MQIFTIRDIENLTGIKAHTWRIWEQRYSLFQTKRKGSAHRIYNNEELNLLLHIAFLYHNGWKISKIAKLTKHTILDEVNNVHLNETTYKTFLLQLLEAAINYNETFFNQILNGIINKVGFENCVIETCYPFLMRIGQLWVTENVIPAQEHFSNYIIQNKIIAETEKLKRPTHPPELLLFSIQVELFNLPLLFLNYLLRKNEWSVVYMGSNTKFDILQQFTNYPNLRYLFLHQITHAAHFDVDDYFDTLCRTFPDQKIIASGSIVKAVQRTFTNLILLKSDKDIIDFIKQ